MNLCQINIWNGGGVRGSEKGSVTRKKERKNKTKEGGQKENRKKRAVNGKGMETRQCSY